MNNPEPTLYDAAMSQKSFIYDPDTREFRPPDIDRKPDPRKNIRSSSRPPGGEEPGAPARPAPRDGSSPRERTTRYFEPGSSSRRRRTRSKGGSKRRRNRKLLFWAMLLAVSIIWVSFLASTIMQKNKSSGGSGRGGGDLPRLPGILE